MKQLKELKRVKLFALLCLSYAPFEVGLVKKNKIQRKTMPTTLSFSLCEQPTFSLQMLAFLVIFLPPPPFKTVPFSITQQVAIAAVIHFFIQKNNIVFLFYDFLIIFFYRNIKTYNLKENKKHIFFEKIILVKKDIF